MWVRSSYSRRRWPMLAALAAIVAVLGIAIGVLATRGSSPQHPPQVTPVIHSSDATQQARNLVAWLRRYSAAG
jgi:zinc transporter ZupT